MASTIVRPPDQPETEEQFKLLPIQERAVQWNRYAADTLNLVEEGNNQGEALEDFMSVLVAGHMDFAPWCAEGQIACAVRAGMKERFFPSGYRRVKVLRDWAKREGRILKPSQVKRGDWFGFVNPITGNGHIGMVIGFEGNWVKTIEFNTNKAGSREGTAVLRKKRLKLPTWFGVKWY